MANELATFFRSLSTLFNAGILVHRALDILGEHQGSLAEQSQGLATLVATGQPLSVALSRFPRTFNPMHVQLIRVGEVSGYLQKILEMIGDYEERRSEAIMRIRNDLLYPAVLLVVSCALLILGPPFLFRGLLTMSASMGVDPPLVTRALLRISTLVASPWFLVFLTGLVGATLAFGKKALRKHSVNRALLLGASKVPGLNRLLRTWAVARFAQSLALQLESGESPLSALPLAAAASANRLLEDRVRTAVEDLEAGQTLAMSLQRTDFFPPGFMGFIRAGEESGHLPGMVKRAAHLVELELEVALETTMQMLEPLTMLVMGGIIAVVILATMLPLVEVLKAF